jgi:hypothetical protein
MSITATKAWLEGDNVLLRYLKQAHPAFCIECGDVMRDLVMKGLQVVQVAMGEATGEDLEATRGESQDHGEDSPSMGEDQKGRKSSEARTTAGSSGRTRPKRTGAQS